MDLTIASWNIRKAVGLDWRRDPERVLRVLATLEADVVLLQEADKRLAPRPPALPPQMVRAAGWTALDADPATPSIGHHGNAVLLRAGWRATRLEAVDLPGLEPRGGVLAWLEGPAGAITVGGLHLGLRHVDRCRQVAAILAALNDVTGPIVLGGDLNEWRSGPDALPLPAGWTVVAPGASFHADRPLVAFDRFLLGPGVTMREADVLPPDRALRASDHLPIRIPRLHEGRSGGRWKHRRVTAG